ncbi:unnamed protein product [Nesidiocoris tenuis]|uniref:RNA-binding motif protein, X-linked 2 n=1 Tax=Nesidiocoris tenuis TaxID=355587 RepID=A0A6H5H7I4_9HEMI|nr:unnamed protein product [Nesidiocoris tenuis]CAB0013683.1 unnamed protein product [Nesidiocoris tenuis]
MKNVQRLSEQELSSNLKTSWHDQYKNSAWVFIGGLPYDLTEGDVICVFSQYGEIVNINLVRDKATGKTKGFCFLCYEDQRSTILAVDNLNGIKILGRTIRVDHVHDYKAPKEKREMTAETVQLLEEGCAANPVYIKKEPSSPEWRKPPNLSNNSVPLKNIKNEKVKKEKKKKKTKDKKRSESEFS